MSLLIIDDETEMLNLLKDFFEKRNFPVAIACNAEDGVKLAQEHLPKLIILDIVMPGMNGYDAVKILRSNEKTSSIPIIIMTGKELTREGIAKRCEELGINDFIYKPISVEDLLKKVSAYVAI